MNTDEFVKKILEPLTLVFFILLLLALGYVTIERDYDQANYIFLIAGVIMALLIHHQITIKKQLSELKSEKKEREKFFGPIIVNSYYKTTNISLITLPLAILIFAASLLYPITIPNESIIIVGLPIPIAYDFTPETSYPDQIFYPLAILDIAIIYLVLTYFGYKLKTKK